MNTYPTRPPFFAHRVVRLMAKSCAANEIGSEAAYLVTCIAMIEDAKRYTGPVTFWNEQLMPIAGFKSWGRLNRARRAAVEAGWLVYFTKSHRGVGHYWTTIPESVSHLDDSPVDESHDHHFGAHESDSTRHDHQNRAHESGSEATETRHDHRFGLGDGDKAEIKRRSNGEPSIPVPFPIPVSFDLIIWFDRFWDTYARKVGKAKSLPKFGKAVEKVAKSKQCQPEQAAEFLIERARVYVADCAAQSRYKMNPLTWLNGEHWNDELDADSGDDFPDVQPKVIAIWQPDLRNTAEVQAALSPEQWRAVKAVGLDRIADTRGDQRALRQQYIEARRATA